MIRELDLVGVYLPPFVLMVLLALPPWLLIRFVLARGRGAPRVWHPPLFHFASFVLVLSLVILAVFH